MKIYKSLKTGREYSALEYCNHGRDVEYYGLKDLPGDEYPYTIFHKEPEVNFNIKVLYYDELSPKLKLGMSTDILLWNAIVFYYHECHDELEELKKTLTSSSHFMKDYFNNCINFIINEMAAFCNEHKVPNTNPAKKGELMPLPIDEYPIWFNNLEDFLVDITWGGKDRKIMMKEVLPKLVNTFETYKDAIASVDFSVKDSSEVENIINSVIETNPDIVDNYKKGKLGLINKLFGEVMKLSGGKIDIKEARIILESKLKV